MRAATSSSWFRGRLPRARLGVAGLLAAVACAAAAPLATADGCPSADDSYTGTCGPQFEVPSWTDAGGWDDPSQYSTIRLADLNGDGKDELIGRSDAGIEIFRFDTTLGQWRPQVDANGTPQLLKDFASFLPQNESDPHNPNQPQYFSTIQAADVDGQPGAEILGRFWDGMRVFKYTPPAGTRDIDGGTWTRVGTGGPFSDADGFDDPSLYSTIRVGKFRTEDPPLLFARQHSQPLATYRWNAGSWVKVTNVFPIGDFDISAFEDPGCSQPACYRDLQTANVAASDPDAGDDTLEVLGRTPSGVSLWDYDAFGKWGPRYDGSPAALADVPGGVTIIGQDDDAGDCPFSARGATGAGSGDCLGSGPSYYETLQAANIDGKPGDELLARASDGLRVKTWDPGHQPPPCCYVEEHLDALPTLTDLSGASFVELLNPGRWGSIRTADLDGDGRDEVLALDTKGLEAWSYDPTKAAWSELQPSTSLALGADPWLTHPEYFSTIHTGDVDGDGRDDVIARGPNGIRTFFYNRRGTGGWERYLGGTGWTTCPGCTYPAFDSQGAQNEQNAYARLNALATPGLISSGTLRDLWAGENAPAPGDVTNVTNRLPGIAGCGAATGSPPQVTACTPPSGSTGFTATQWTTVVNQMLAESDAASEVLAFFDELKSMRDDLFLQESAELPAIGSDLGLQAAAAITAQFNPLALMSGALGIAASIAGILPGIGPELSAALWVGAEVTSMIPQTSPTATSSAFPSTYAGLQAKFATMVGETVKGLGVMSQEVRQSSSLLNLVSALRTSGPWATKNLDTIGLQSAANQGFATWIYQTLVPTVYDRYDITQCAVYGNALCSGPTSGTTGVIGGATSSNDETPFDFIALGSPRDLDAGVPCKNDEQDEVPDCTYTTPVSSLSTSVWGIPSDQCSYVPGQSATAWTFGTCDAGVDPRSSIGANTWNFTTYSGAFDVSTSHCGWPYGGCWHTTQARAAQALGARGPIRLARPRSGRRAAVRGRARIQASIGLPRGMRLEGATVRLNRLLFEPRFRELTAPRTRRGEQPLTLTLSRVGPGRFAAASGGRRWVRVAMRRRRGVRASLTLTAARVYHAPRACHALPAAVALKTRPTWLHTRVVIGDGRHRLRVGVDHHVRCRRDARGEVDRLEYVRNRRHRLRPGPAITLRGPSSVTPGARGRYVARVQNPRHGRDRLRSSLWDVTLVQGARTKRIHELRRGRTRSVGFVVRVPGDARGRFCVAVGAAAPGAHADSARVCSRVRALLPPKFTG